jgi:hypothetical protein
MSRGARRAGAGLLAGLALAAHAQEFKFDAAEFERRPFELGGYVEAKGESFKVRQDSVLGRLTAPELAARERLDRATGTLELAGKLAQDALSFDWRARGTASADAIETDSRGRVFEADFGYRVSDGVSLNAGKRVVRWGKGYAWNPVGFVERPKDPNDPQLSREGFVMATGEFVATGVGPFAALGLTAVALPASEDVNSAFGQGSHVNPAVKLYGLVADTDIDLMWLGKGSRPGRVGFDFSRNLGANLEIHGEWARIFDFQQRVVDAAGAVATQSFDATSWLLGLRYLTEREVTWIVEYYRNGTGYSDSELESFFRFADTALATAPPATFTPLVQRAASLAQSGYGQPNPGRDYLYVRTSAKEPGDILYLTPAVTAIVNLQDGSYSLTPEVVYTGFTNWELRGRIVLLHGARYSDFGERPNERRLEFYARLYF